MKYFILALFLSFSIQQTLAQKIPSQQTQKKIQKKIQKKKKNKRKINSLMSNEEIYTEMVDDITSTLQSLPQICTKSSSLYVKTKQFQRKLSQLKPRAMEVKLARRQYGFLFDHPLDNLFAINSFITYVYEDRFQHNFPIPKKESVLKKELKMLSDDFQLMYRANFKDDLTPVSKFPLWARYIAESLECLSQNRKEKN